MAKLTIEQRCRLEAAGLKGRQLKWSFKSAPTQVQNSTAYKAVKAWSNTKTPKPPGLVLYGPAGLGKTGLAISTVRERAFAGDGAAIDWVSTAHPDVRRGMATKGLRVRAAPVWFESWASISMRLWSASMNGVDRSDPRSVGELIDELQSLSLLVVDDLDVGTYTEFREMVMLSILERVSLGKRLIIVMNRAPEELIDSFGERVADRLQDTEMVLVIPMSGESLRRK